MRKTTTDDCERNEWAKFSEEYFYWKGEERFVVIINLTFHF